MLDIKEISQRADSITEFKIILKLFKKISSHLENISDLERLITKVNSGTANPRDLISISSSLEQITHIKTILKKSNISKLKWLESPIKTHLKTIGLINSAINIDSSTLVGNGKTIQKGFSKKFRQLNRTFSKLSNIYSQSRK